MSNHPHHDNGRESLSALFDGELRDDAARFALKRLEHDHEWREACGRWQLAGDVLRGRADAMAPAGFADRVAGALQASPVGAVAGGRSAQAGYRRRWIGGAALAASVALAALLVPRPSTVPSPDAGVATVTPAAVDNAAAVGTQDSAASPMLASGNDAAEQGTERGLPTRPSTPSVPASIALAGAAVAAAETPRRAAAERRVRSSAAAAADASQSRSDMPGTVDAPLTVASMEPVESTTDALRPFLPQGEIQTRPWPRAALPDYPRGGAFTASFGDDDAPSPSFYPFEPERLDPGLVAGDAATDWPRN